MKPKKTKIIKAFAIIEDIKIMEDVSNWKQMEIYSRKSAAEKAVKGVSFIPRIIPVQIHIPIKRK